MVSEKEFDTRYFKAFTLPIANHDLEEIVSPL